MAELLSRLSTDECRTLRHALICPPCRELLLGLATEDEEVTVAMDAPTPHLTALWDRVGAEQDRRTRELDEDEARADALCGQLLSMPAAERGRMIETNARFASPGVARRLLAASAEVALLQPDAAIRLALAAGAVAERLDAGRFSTTLAVELAAMALCREADARRLTGDPEAAEAEAAFECAAHALDAEDLESPARALFCRLLAALRNDQGRIDEALGLLARAATIYSTLELRQDLADALTDAGTIRIEDGDPATALPPLLRAAALDDPACNPRRAIRTRQALALCYAGLGRTADADSAMAAARPLYESFTAAADRLRFSWMEARLDHECKRHLAAIDRLQLVVAGFIAEEPYEAAAALVDLWRIVLATGSSAELPALREAAEAILRREDLHPRARAVLDLAMSTASRRRIDQEGLLEGAARYLARARHHPDRRFEPLDEEEPTQAALAAQADPLPPHPHPEPPALPSPQPSRRR